MYLNRVETKEEAGTCIKGSSGRSDLQSARCARVSKGLMSGTDIVVHVRNAWPWSARVGHE